MKYLFLSARDGSGDRGPGSARKPKHSYHWTLTINTLWEADQWISIQCTGQAIVHRKHKKCVRTKKWSTMRSRFCPWSSYFDAFYGLLHPLTVWSVKCKKSYWYSCHLYVCSQLDHSKIQSNAFIIQLHAEIDLETDKYKFLYQANLNNTQGSDGTCKQTCHTRNKLFFLLCLPDQHAVYSWFAAMSCLDDGCYPW